jgi:ankyrin repeat protein
MASAEELEEAVKSKDALRVRDLLEREPALAHATLPGGTTPALLAIYHRSVEVLEALLAAGTELSVFEAAAAGFTDRLREELRMQPDLVTARSQDGWTALHLAAHFGHTEAMQSLLDAGADVHARSTNGLANQPLHAAVAGGSAGAVALLLSRGADPSATQHGGWTPLQAAAQAGHLEVLRLLLEQGADPAARNAEGATALALAERHHRDAAVALLREVTAGRR